MQINLPVPGEFLYACSHTHTHTLDKKLYLKPDTGSHSIDRYDYTYESFVVKYYCLKRAHFLLRLNMRYRKNKQKFN